MKQHPELWKFLGYLVAPSAISADNTPAAVSISGYDSVRVAVGVGVGGITFSDTDKIEFKLRDGGATVGAHAAVDAVDVVMPTGDSLGANGIIRSLTAAHATPTQRFYDYVGAETYLSCLADFSGTHGAVTPMFVAVYGLRGRLNPPV